MIQALIGLIIYLIIIGVILWLLVYLIQEIPLPEPFNRIARTVVIVIGILIVILLLLNFIGEPVSLHMPRMWWSLLPYLG